MNLTANNKDNFKKMHVYTVLIKGITPSSWTNANLKCFWRSAFYAGIKITTSTYRSQKRNGTIYITIQLNTHSFYKADEFLGNVDPYVCKIFTKSVR